MIRNARAGPCAGSHETLPGSHVQNSRAPGFTLLEVMIAMAMLAITLVTAFQSQSQSISMASESRFETTAPLLAQSKMAEIEAMKMSDVNAGEGDFGEKFPDYTWRVEVNDTEFEALKKIEVKVTSSALKSRNAYRLVLYRFVME
ncbi:MAG: type II secretion system minor pseudopilin GspI [Deltaproteobacteria bacterium]|nr:type II secretion system minor pseudopilin GspI [Deltaproteobacteria bacterium]